MTFWEGDGIVQSSGQESASRVATMQRSPVCGPLRIVEQQSDADHRPPDTTSEMKRTWGSARSLRCVQGDVEPRSAYWSPSVTTPLQQCSSVKKQFTFHVHFLKPGARSGRGSYGSLCDNSAGPPSAQHSPVCRFFLSLSPPSSFSRPLSLSLFSLQVQCCCRKGWMDVKVNLRLLPQPPPFFTTFLLMDDLR